MNFDCVIPVAGKDCAFLRKTIPILFKNIEFENLYIITKPQYFIYFKAIVKKFPNRVILINEFTVLDSIQPISVSKYLEKFNNNPVSCTWYYQQFLKMGFALSDYCCKEYYLIWDADTVPLKKINFFSKDNIPYFSMKNENNTNYFITINNLFGLRKVNSQSFICENMMIKAYYMREIIDKISKIEVSGENWCEKIIASLPQNTNNAFSEFETYGTYVQVHYPNSYLFRELSTFRDAGRYFLREDLKRSIVKLSQSYDVASFEHRHNPQSVFKNLLSGLIKTSIYSINKFIDIFERNENSLDKR